MCCGIPVATGYATTRYYPPPSPGIRPASGAGTVFGWFFCHFAIIVMVIVTMVLYVRLWSIPQNGQNYAK